MSAELLNPMWIAVGISLFGVIITPVLAYQASLRGTAVALARFEERQKFQGEDLRRIRVEQEELALLVNEHETRMAVVEKLLEMRPPLDYPSRRG